MSRRTDFLARHAVAPTGPGEGRGTAEGARQALWERWSMRTSAARTLSKYSRASPPSPPHEISSILPAAEIPHSARSYCSKAPSTGAVTHSSCHRPGARCEQRNASWSHPVAIIPDASNNCCWFMLTWSQWSGFHGTTAREGFLRVNAEGCLTWSDDMPTTEQDANLRRGRTRGIPRHPELSTTPKQALPVHKTATFGMDGMPDAASDWVLRCEAAGFRNDPSRWSSGVRTTRLASVIASPRIALGQGQRAYLHDWAPMLIRRRSARGQVCSAIQ